MNDRRILRDAARLRLILFQGKSRHNQSGNRGNHLPVQGSQKKSDLCIAGISVRPAPPERGSERGCFRGRFRENRLRKNRPRFPAADRLIAFLLFQKYSYSAPLYPSSFVMKSIFREIRHMRFGKRGNFIGIFFRFQALEKFFPMVGKFRENQTMKATRECQKAMKVPERA